MVTAPDHLEIGPALAGMVRELGNHPDETGVFVQVHNASPEVLQGLANSLALVCRIYAEKREAVSADVISAIVDELLPKAPASSTLFMQAKMKADAKKAVLASGDWITANQITELANFSAANPSQQPSKWKREKRIFAIRHEGIDYFPLYGLDEANGYRPVPALKGVISVLAACKDDWGMAYWFASVNGRLGGQAPKALIQSEPERVLAAAGVAAAGIAHG